MSASVQLKVVGKSVVDQHAAQVAGSVAEGQAVADAVVRYAKGENETLKQFLVRIQGLTKEGRTAFRAQLDITLEAIRGNIKALGNTALAKRAAAIGRVRISECRGFSIACDRGFNISTHARPEDGYSALIALSVAFRNSTATAGPSVKRGRKALSWEEKLANYVTKTLGLHGEQLDVASVILRKMARTPTTAKL